MMTTHSYSCRGCCFDASAFCGLCAQESERVSFQVIPIYLKLHNFGSHPAFASQSFLAQIDQIADKCNYNSYLKKFLTYPPPPAPFTLPGTSVEADPGCNVYKEIIGAALLLNPAFNIYRIFDMVYYLLLIHLPPMTLAFL
jgi:hypothetical protein